MWKATTINIITGRRANGFYITRFTQNLFGDKEITCAALATRARQTVACGAGIAEYSIGAEFKDALTEPGAWSIGMGGFGELLPYHENKITLDKTRKDKWGLPILAMDAIIRDNELKCAKTFLPEGQAMFEPAA